MWRACAPSNASTRTAEVEVMVASGAGSTHGHPSSPPSSGDGSHEPVMMALVVMAATTHVSASAMNTKTTTNTARNHARVVNQRPTRFRESLITPSPVLRLPAPPSPHLFQKFEKFGASGARRWHAREAVSPSVHRRARAAVLGTCRRRREAVRAARRTCRVQWPTLLWARLRQSMA